MTTMVAIMIDGTYLQVKGVVGEENQVEGLGITASVPVPPPLVQLHRTSSTSGSCQPDSPRVQVATLMCSYS